VNVIIHDFISDKLIQQIAGKLGTDMNSKALVGGEGNVQNRMNKPELSGHLKDDTYKSRRRVEFI
jgi:hypothetical protein